MAEQRRGVRACLQKWWSVWKWRIVGFGAALAFLLGWRGFWLGRVGEGWNLADCALLSLQLFILESSVCVHGNTAGWELQVARWLAPLASSAAAITGLLLLFRQEFRVWQMSHLEGHAVVCGLGGKGGRLATGELREGKTVVAIEQDSEASYWRDVEARGGLVTSGNLEDPQVLIQARAHCADAVYCATGSDEMNVRIVEHLDRSLEGCRDGARRNSGPKCFVHIRDASIRSLLATRFSDAKSALRVTPFSVFESGARALLLEHSAFSMGDDGLLLPRPVAVVGSSPLALELLEELAETWAMDPGSRTGTGLAVAALEVEEPAGGWPPGLDVRELTGLEDGSFISALDKSGDLTPLVYLCLEDQNRALSLAAGWLRSATGPAEIVLCSVGQYTTLASFVRPVVGQSVTLYSFDLLDRTCSPSLVTGGIHEDVARGIHSVYMGIYDDNTTWKALDIARQRDNIRLARFVAANLFREQLRFRRWCEGDPTGPPDLPDGRWEALAAREHHRWKAGKEADGWRYGENRDNAHRLNPYMLPWDDLHQDKKEENRKFIRGVLGLPQSYRLRVVDY